MNEPERVIPWPDVSRQNARVLVVKMSDGDRRLCVRGKLGFHQKRYLHRMGFYADDNGYIVSESLKFRLSMIQQVFPFVEVRPMTEAEIGVLYDELASISAETDEDDARRPAGESLSKEEMMRRFQATRAASGVAPKQAEDAPKLAIELVPESCWFSNVRSRVTALEWNRLKRMSFVRAGYTCEICGEVGTEQGHEHPVECHEVFSFDEKTLTQRLERFECLCPECHEVKHFGLSEARGRGEEAAKRLGRINGWSAEQVSAYISQMYERWHRHSKLEWKLDISLLDQFNVRVRMPNKEENPESDDDVSDQAF